MPLTQEQIEARIHGIGGSDAAAVLGINPWKTALEVYLEKTGETEPPNLEDNDAVHFGNVLEDVVADEYSRRTGLAVRRSNKTHKHPEHEFMLAHLDRLIVGEKRLLECKTAGAHMAREWGDPGSDEVPESYLCQVQHYLAVTGLPLADLAVLIGGRDFRIYTIERSEKLIRALTEYEREFWHEHVLARRPPDPQPTLQDVARRWPREQASARLADPSIHECLLQLQFLKQQAKEIAGKSDELEVRIKSYMGDHQTLVDEDGRVLANWKVEPRSTLDSKALRSAHPAIAEEFTHKVEPRVFRLKKILDQEVDHE